jgi:hypothetical protein
VLEVAMLVAQVDQVAVEATLAQVAELDRVFQEFKVLHNKGILADPVRVLRFIAVVVVVVALAVLAVRLQPQLVAVLAVPVILGP